LKPTVKANNASVVSFVSCECPGRTLVPTLGIAAKLSQIKPDVIHFSACMAKAQPGCAYIKVEDMAKLVEEKTGVKVILGTHDYH
jgi:predicted metal-binding protein